MSIIPTPAQARVISQLPLVDPEKRKSIRVPCSTIERGLEAIDMQIFYQKLRLLEQTNFGSIVYRLQAPHHAFAQGFVLLNGCKLIKDHFPDYAKLLESGLANEDEEDRELIILKDLTKHYLRSALREVGISVPESLPNITGNISFNSSVGSATLAFTRGAASSINPGGHLTSSETRHSVSMNASRSHAAYGRREEVAPLSIHAFAYTYVGLYTGPALEPISYQLKDSEETLILAGSIGYNELYMQRQETEA